MLTVKRLYKLIISAFVTALCFVVFSLTAFADPITAAMMTSGMISGMGFTQIAGATAASSGVFKMPSGYSDPLDWDDTTNWLNGTFKVRIDNSETTGNVDITLSNGIAKNGYARLSALQSAYGLLPGQTHVVGGYPAIDGYIFYNNASGYYYGGDLGILHQDDSYVVTNNIYFVTEAANPNNHYWANSIIGNYNGYHIAELLVNGSYYGQHVVLYMNPNKTGINFGVREGFHVFGQYQDSTVTGVPTVTENVSVNRELDSVMTDPVDDANVVTIPENYVSNYQSSIGTDIANKSDVEAILNAIYEAYNNDEVDDSVYLPPPGPAPTPVPGETIADTPYSDLHGDLGDVSDTIGIGNGVLEDIKDILDNTTDGLKDTVEDISDALTSTVDGIKKGVNTISQTLTGIASHVAQLVQEIVDADYNWTSGVINNFFNAFTDWFSTLRSHVSIWHYVVEWLSDISTCFAFFWGVQSAAGYRFILPIYAAFAGTIVIAIYRRFGK